jgi:hypothetical protein
MAKRCSWCETLVQPRPGTNYCEIMGWLFPNNPFQCRRGDSPKGGANQSSAQSGNDGRHRAQMEGKKGRRP